MSKRHEDALFAQAGACNGLAVAGRLTAIYAECLHASRDTGKMNRDPAIQLILHQLCHLAGILTESHARLRTVRNGGFNWEIAMQICVDLCPPMADGSLKDGLFGKRKPTTGLEGLDYDDVLGRAMDLALADDPSASADIFAWHFQEWMDKAAALVRSQAAEPAAAE